MVWFLLAINVNSNEPVIPDGPFSSYEECRNEVFETTKAYNTLRENSHYSQLKCDGVNTKKGE